MQITHETIPSLGRESTGLRAHPENVQEHLRLVILQYLSENPRLTLNGLSQRCSVSEPTLRRICKGQIKTAPTVTTVVDILSYILKTQKINKLAEAFPGPIAEMLKEKSAQVGQVSEPFSSEQLNHQLKDPVKFIIYKLACQPQGVSNYKISMTFGNYGLSLTEELVHQGLLTLVNESYFAKINNFILSDELFIDHFKAFADFIKPHKLSQASRAHSPLFANYSGSINKQAYANIVKIQRQALKKISRILNDPNSSGPIPSFVLNAIDTMDRKAAYEIE